MGAAEKQDNKAIKLNDAMVSNLEKNKRIVHSLDGRGAGAIYFDRQGGDSVVAYYRYRHDAKTQAIRIGAYKRRNTKGAGFTFAELIAEGTALANLRAEYPDLKAHLEQQQQFEIARQAEQARLDAIEAAKGTFRQLFLSYIADREAAGIRPDQVRDFQNIMQKNLEPFPELMAMRARDVAPAHINQILSRIVERGVLRQAAKVRSFLMAAFTYGMKKDNQIGSAEAVTFDIQSNPVAAVTFNDEHKKVIHKVGERALSEAELKQFYNTIDNDVKGVSYAMAQLFKMVIATGGQRIEQLAREPWSSYTDDIIKLTDAKGRDGKARSHYVPLSERSRAILQSVADVTGNHSHPFSYLREKHFSVYSFSKATAHWLASDHAVIDGVRVEPFTPRDLRRTLAQLMQKHGISNEGSDELQSHGMSGVVAAHYRNNPEASIPSKTKTMQAVDRMLDCVLDGKEVGVSNVVKMRSRL